MAHLKGEVFMKSSKDKKKDERRRCVVPGCGKFVAKERNFCDEHAEPCWCPCGCGCREPDHKVNPSGLCPDCEEGNHEVPPDWVKTGVEKLLALHQSIVHQYKEVMKFRKKFGREPICHCRDKDCAHERYAREHQDDYIKLPGSRRHTVR